MTTRNAQFARRGLTVLLVSLSSCLLVILLTACTAFPIGNATRMQEDKNPQPALSGAEGSEVRNPKPAVVLPQPAGATVPTVPATRGQIVEIRISRVRDLSEILVQAGDRVKTGQALARLSGYAEELNWDVRLIELELVEARATLGEARLAIEAQEKARQARLELEQTQAETAQQRAIEAAQATKEKAIAQAEAEVTRLRRRIEDLEREMAMAGTRLAMAQAEVDYRRRWLEVLEPLGEFDPWGDLPYLVGSQSGPKGLRSDLAYREALARARYDLRLAELELDLAEAEVAKLDTTLLRARSDLAGAQADLEAMQAMPLDVATYQPSVTFSPPISRTAQVQEASVRVNELRLARARAELEKTVVKSLVAGKVLDVRVDRVDGNEATVMIRVTAER